MQRIYAQWYYEQVQILKLESVNRGDIAGYMYQYKQGVMGLWSHRGLPFFPYQHL